MNLFVYVLIQSLHVPTHDTYEGRRKTRHKVRCKKDVRINPVPPSPRLGIHHCHSLWHGRRQLQLRPWKHKMRTGVAALHMSQISEILSRWQVVVVRGGTLPSPACFSLPSMLYESHGRLVNRDAFLSREIQAWVTQAPAKTPRESRVPHSGGESKLSVCPTPGLRDVARGKKPEVCVRHFGLGRKRNGPAGGVT